jgi:hypothetical protein
MNRSLRQKNVVMFALIVTIVSLMFMQQVFADIIIENPHPQVGDLVHIRIIPALQTQTMVIITPNTTYRFIGGIPENAAFIPQSPGQHIIRIVDDNTLVDTVTFTVSDSSAPSITKATQHLTLSATSIRTGEPLLVDGPVIDVQKIVVKTQTKEMHYIDAARPVTYLAEEAGVLEVILLYTNGSKENQTVIVQGPDNPFPTISEEPVAENFTVDSGSDLIETSDNKTVNAALIWEQHGAVVRQTATSLFDMETLPVGTYDLEVQMHGKSLRSIRFTDLHYDPATAVGIEEVAPHKIKGNVAPATIDAFAIDPTLLNFSSATITFVATGNALYKCVDYNFSTQTCMGDNVKIRELIPGNTYTLIIDARDPLFSQTGYLSNPNFENGITSWTTLNEAADLGAFGVGGFNTPFNNTGDINTTNKGQSVVANYYQQFNLTIPAGTTLSGVNFSFFWRVPTYSNPGRVNFSIQNSARTLIFCNITRAFTGVTGWVQENMTTGQVNCPLGNFTKDTNYTVRLRCNLVTANSAGALEICKWDNISVIVWYNDITPPVLFTYNDTPDPVNFSEKINISLNITDNIAIADVFVEINGTNRTMILGPANTYYYDLFDTAILPGIYFYKIFVNDTNNNRVTNSSNLLNFTVRDVIAPLINISTPSSQTYTNANFFTAFFNLSDQVGVSNCSLNVSGILANSTRNPTLGLLQNLTAALSADGQYLWNITCNDTSGNRNTTTLRTIYRDTVPPAVFLNLSNATILGNTSFILNYTARDATLANCSLWHNFNGSWALNKTDNAPQNYSLSTFWQNASEGSYLWTVECNDSAGNDAFNRSNYTITIDVTPPQWSNIQTYPASNVAYTPGATYQFNVTWNDNFAVNTTFLETNITGVLVNVTPTKVGNVYTYTFADLAAGSYVYRWYANDSANFQNNKNITAQLTFNVVKATAVMNLTFNGTDADITVNLDDTLNITGNVTTPSVGYVEIYVEQVRVANGSSPLSNISVFNLQKRYNVTLFYNETQNYSLTNKTHFVTVADTQPPKIILNDPVNGSITQSTVRFFFTPSDNIDIANCTVVLDGTRNTTNVSIINALNNITITGIPDGFHNWTINCSDASNNSAINNTPKNFTVDTVAPSEFNLTLPLSGNISSNLTPTFIWNQSVDPNFANYTVQVDNDVNFGSINYIRNMTGLTNVSTAFTLLDQVIWYWRVLAIDLALNQRTSSTYNYTTDATPPLITLGSPSTGRYANSTRVNLTYTPSDFTNITNCSLYVNGTFNQTNTTINNTNINWFISDFGHGTYNWSIVCYDIVANRNNSVNNTLTIDLIQPITFPLLSPANNTLTTNTTPTYTWTQTTDQNFANYTIQVSDVEDFSHVNHSFVNTPITNTSLVQTPALTDGTWYWRVIAFDLAGNQKIMHPTYIVDTTSPTAFDLYTPNDTQQRNDTPLFMWEQSNDTNFKNYTLIVSDSIDFSTVLYTNSTNQSNMTNATLLVVQNTTLYWKVVAYDLVNHSTNSTHSFVYVADFLLPNVTLGSPANLSVINLSSLVPLTFNVTDVGTIANCTLYIDDVVDRVINTPQKNTTLTISSNVDNGNHWWNVSCTDVAGNIGRSVVRNFTVNVSVPIIRLYENSKGDFVSAGVINLSSNDSVENSISFSVNSATFANAVNATLVLNGTGMLIRNNTKVNFSGVFSQSNINIFFVTWKLLIVNTSGTTIICQSGNDNNGGTPIGSTAKKTLAGNCTNTRGDIRMYAGDNLTLAVDVYNDGGTARTFTHFWDSVDASFMQLPAYKLGTLNVTFTNYSDPRPTEGTANISECNVTCLDGYCLSTEVYWQIYNGTQWLNVSTTGNMTLNGSQVNPVSIGDLNGSQLVNFSLFASTYSYNNSLTCYAVATTTQNTSAIKNISVIDRTLPEILLNSPTTGAAFPAQDITFQYTPYDIHLKNCSLWGNFSGVWELNQTAAVVVNATMNSFPPVYLDYGYYLWNVQCTDLEGNTNFNITNFTLNIAGDVEITSPNITFSTSTPVEGQQIFIYANVTNKANKTESNVTVQFWDGDPAAGGVQIGADKNVTLARLSNNLTNMSWVLPLGLHQVYVVLDPYNTIVESTEANNKANNSILVPMWQVYYGNVSGNVTLGNSLNSTFLQWFLTNKSGNIYITDSDTTNGVQFLTLQAISRNTTGQNNTNTNDDFENIDTMLSTSTLTDSVNSTYTTDVFPTTVGTFTVFGRDIANVAYANSSTDRNFTTAILWDTDDSANSFYDTSDKEDLVFFTKISNNTVGAYGYVDYEIKVPSRLKNYKGSTNTVDFYYELQ